MDTARKTEYRQCHITHIIHVGKECYSKASLTVDHEDKKCLYFRNGNILGTNDGLERQMDSPHDIYPS